MAKIKKPVGFDPTRKPAKGPFGEEGTTEHLKSATVSVPKSEIGSYKSTYKSPSEKAYEADKSKFDFSKDIEAITGKKTKKRK